MPADCKPYYYTGNFEIVKEKSGEIVYSMQKKSVDFLLHIFLAGDGTR